jgi:hypothetical protein
VNTGVSKTSQAILGCIGTISTLAKAPTSLSATNEAMNDLSHLGRFDVVEFRRYTIKPGHRDEFVKYFDTFFPEAFQQLGALALGQFCERSDKSRFTWMRGFHTLNDRPIANSAFYFGPLWREHRARINALLADSDNVLLLRPLRAEDAVMVLPEVDPVIEERGTEGIVVAQIFALKSQPDDSQAARIANIFAIHRIPEVHQAGLLTTLDVPNNFPQLPVRTDGVFIVWLGVIRDEETLNQRLRPLAQSATESLTSLGLLRGPAELVVLDPTPRSRLRWLPDWNE